MKQIKRDTFIYLLIACFILVMLHWRTGYTPVSTKNETDMIHAENRDFIRCVSTILIDSARQYTPQLRDDVRKCFPVEEQDKIQSVYSLVARFKKYSGRYSLVYKDNMLELREYEY